MIHLIHITLAAFAFRFFRELEDEIARGKLRNWSIMPNSNDGWTAKWKFPLQEYKPKWYHFGIHPKHAERFPYSSTVFVWLTDAEHFYQFVQTASIIAMLYAATQLPTLQAIAATLAGFAAAQIAKEIIKKIN